MDNIKQKWLEALRSGNYQQCAGELSNGVGFCCVGVLADVLGKTIPYVNVRGPDEEAHLNGKLYRELRNLIPLDLNPYIEMNDDGKSFNEIADKIEEEWA